MTGRPSNFTQALADTICERLADGESLRSITAVKGMPNRTTVNQWLIKDPVFQSQYARAREAQADTIFDECIDIADDARNDFMMRRGEQVVDNEAVQRARLRIDTRKWMAGKLRPKKYGDISAEQSIQDNRTFTITIGHGQNEDRGPARLPHCIDVSPKSN